MVISASVLLKIVGCILFVIAALCFGVVSGQAAWAFAFGAFAAWVLSQAVP